MEHIVEMVMYMNFVVVYLIFEVIYLNFIN